jgi:general stress protein YciG
MTATRAGGLKAAKVSKQRYGDNFHRIIGAKGGRISRGGGFSKMGSEFASEQGRIGGATSRRGKARKSAPSAPLVPDPGN